MSKKPRLDQRELENLIELIEIIKKEKGKAAQNP